MKLIESAQRVYVPDMFSKLGDDMRHNESNNIGTFCVPDEQYHGINEYNGKPVISQSSLKKFNENPETYHAGLPFLRSRVVVLGSLLDSAVLNQVGLDDYFFLEGKEADGRTKEGKAIRGKAKGMGKETVNETELNQIHANIDKLAENSTAIEILSGATTQIQMLDTRGEIGKRGMLDIIPDREGRFGDGICDLKRTSKFLPYEWRQHVRSMYYHWQAAYYLDLWNEICKAHGQDDQTRDKWYFLLSDSNAPYGCGVAKLSEELIKKGREGYMNALMKYQECITTGNYPNPWNQGEILTIEPYSK